MWDTAGLPLKPAAVSADSKFVEVKTEQIQAKRWMLPLKAVGMQVQTADPSTSLGMTKGRVAAQLEICYWDWRKLRIPDNVNGPWNG
jgi:hypothetical protein